VHIAGDVIEFRAGGSEDRNISRFCTDSRKTGSLSMAWKLVRSRAGAERNARLRGIEPRA
jgi:hypothetical protein